MKLSKVESTEISPKGIAIWTNEITSIGVAYCSGEFVPVSEVELTLYELKQIVAIIENFKLFYENID